MTTFERSVGSPGATSDDSPQFTFSRLVAELNLFQRSTNENNPAELSRAQGEDLQLVSLSSRSNFEDIRSRLVPPPSVALLDRRVDSGAYRATVNPAGRVSAFVDPRGEWRRLNDVWVRQNSRETDFFAGSVTVDNRDTIHVNNTDSGVRTEIDTDGTRRLSLETADHHRYQVTINPSGRTTGYLRDGAEWSTTDGKNWTSSTGQRWQGALGVDEFGRYWERPAGGERTILARSAALDNVLRETERLSRAWNIRFAQPGDSINLYETNYTCRAPRADELRALETVLYRNQQMDVNALQFAFVNPGRLTDSNTMWGCYSRSGNNGNPRVSIMPLRPGAMGWQALEGTLEHELVHHEQYNLWGASEWGSASSPASTTRLIADMGWRRDRTRGVNIFHDRAGNEWERVDSRWAPIVDGKPSGDTASRVTDEAMRGRARVRPSTNYFNNPGEMHAECMAMFRMSRELLFTESRQLYDLCRRWDQEGIDAGWGTAGGRSRVIRAIDGSLVQASEANLRAVRETEERWQNRPLPSPAAPRPGMHSENTRLCGCCRPNAAGEAAR